MGGVPEGVASLFPNAKVFAMTQEFGTLPSVLVFQALRAENAMYHFDPANRLEFAQQVRNVFYLHSNRRWKRVLIQRGDQVFDQMLRACIKT